jgi:hypothetical protein
MSGIWGEAAARRVDRQVSPPLSVARPPRPSDRFELYTYSIKSSPNGNTAVDGIIDDQAKIVGKRDGFWQQQPHAGWREVSYHAFEAKGSLEQDQASLRILVPLGRSSLNRSVLHCRQVAIPGDAIPLELRQAQPSFGLKRVEALNTRIISPKRECNALQTAGGPSSPLPLELSCIATQTPTEAPSEPCVAYAD